MTSTEIRAVLFDAYGTLLDLASALHGVEAELGERGPRLNELWRRKQLEYTWLRSLMGRHADFWQVTGDSLDYALAALALTDDGLRARLLQAYRRLHAYPEVAEVLRELRELGLATAILSNGEPGMLGDAVTAAGLGELLDHVLSVEAVAVYKPEPRVYALAARTLAVEPAAIAFVSSNGWDACGAAAFGFHTVWVNRSAQPRERLPGSLAGELTTLAPLPAHLRPLTSAAQARS